MEEDEYGLNPAGTVMGLQDLVADAVDWLVYFSGNIGAGPNPVGL